MTTSDSLVDSRGGFRGQLSDEHIAKIEGLRDVAKMPCKQILGLKLL